MDEHKDTPAAHEHSDQRRRAERRAQDRALRLDFQREQQLRVEMLHGTVRALAQLLAVTDAIAYTQALRVQRLAKQLAEAASLPPSWDLESAALLASLGNLSLASELQERANRQEPIDTEEQGVLNSLPALTDRLLAPIPGLEDLRSILLLRHRRPLPTHWRDQFGAEHLLTLERLSIVLRIAAEFDALLGRGLSQAEALGLLRSEALPMERPFVEALSALHAGDAPAVEMRSLPLARLRAGMVIAEAVYTSAGQLLVNRGFEINESFLERMHNYRRGLVREPIQVILPPTRKT